ncbi:hypothetical protein TNCV_214311 [Trichonephila clavipes]|nr:hypothetical protein TNCV_214311 [Trichonephila clavipes]
MTPVEDPAIVFASAQLILLYLDGCSCLPSASRHALFERSVKAMVGRHILEDIVGRVSKKNCHTVKCMPLDNKCRIPLAGAPPDTCAVVISTETESGFITEDDTSPVCHTPSCPRSAKSSRHCL